MERTPSIRARGALGSNARRQALGAASAALLLGASVAVAGPKWGSILVGGALFLVLLLIVAWDKPGACVAALAFLIPLQVRLNLTGNLSLAIGFVAISGLALVAAYRELLAPLAVQRAACNVQRKGGTAGIRALPPHVARRTLHVALPLTLFVGAALTSLWAAQEFGEAARRALYLAWFLTLFWLTPRLIRDAGSFRHVMRAMAAATGIAAIIGLAQFALQFVFGALPVAWLWAKNVTPILEGERVATTYLTHGTNWILHVGGVPFLRAIGPFSGPPDVAQYLGVAVPVMAAVAFHRPRPRIIELLVLAVTLIFLGASFSRQGWVGIFFAFVVMTLLGSGRKSIDPVARIARRMGMVLAAAGAAGVLLLTAGTTQQTGPAAGAVDRLRSIVDPRDTSNQERFATWIDAIGLVEQRPLLGAGLGNYAVVLGDRRGAYSHNTYLDVLVETGPLGLLGFLLLLGWAFTAALNVASLRLWALGSGLWTRADHTQSPEPRAQSSEHSELQAFGLGAAGAVVALAVIFFFDDAFYSPRAGQAFWLLLGLIAAAGRLIGGEGGATE